MGFIHFRRILFSLCLVFIMAGLFTGCGQAAPPESIRMGVMYSTDIVPLVMMKEQKLDEKYGFHLEMEVFSSAKDRDAALQAGELDGVFTDYIGMCIYHNAGLDLKITGVTDGDYLLLAGEQSGVSTLAEAAGHSIAISENTLIEYTLDYLLEEQGLSDDYLKKEVVPKIPERLELLRSGGVALGLMPDPFAALAMDSGARVLGSANTSGLYPAVSAFTGEALQKRGGDIRKFYEAYDQAAEYCNVTPLTDFEPVLLRDAGYPPELAGKITLPTFRKRQLPPVEALEQAIRWAAAQGLCDSGLTPADLLGPET